VTILACCNALDNHMHLASIARKVCEIGNLLNLLLVNTSLQSIIFKITKNMERKVIPNI